MTRPRVSDEVWAQLDPRGARLSRADRNRIAVAAVVAAILGLAYVLGTQSGQLQSQLGFETYASDSNIATHAFTVRYRLTNAGWFDERIRSVSSAEGGVRLTGMNPSRFTIAAGGSREVVLHYQVIDCSAVRAGPSRSTLHLDRFWGTYSVTIPTPDLTSDGPAARACNR